MQGPRRRASRSRLDRLIGRLRGRIARAGKTGIGAALVPLIAEQFANRLQDVPVETRMQAERVLARRDQAIDRITRLGTKALGRAVVLAGDVSDELLIAPEPIETLLDVPIDIYRGLGEALITLTDAESALVERARKRAAQRPATRR